MVATHWYITVFVFIASDLLLAGAFVYGSIRSTVYVDSVHIVCFVLILEYHLELVLNVARCLPVLGHTNSTKLYRLLPYIQRATDGDTVPHS